MIENLIRTTGLVLGTTSVNQSRTTLGQFWNGRNFITANIAFSGS
jgi:hypothetical protein